MSGRVGNPFYAIVFGFMLLFGGFLTGWLASRHLVLAEEKTVQASPSPSHGAVPGTVHHEVRQALRGFQDGYTRRDLNQLGAFMRQHFPRINDCLVMGTEPGEWIRGHERIEKFIRNDWQNWGDVRLDVDAPLISTVGDVAWLATAGTVSFRGSAHPIRFTTTLVREEGRWLFRQVQFQWDNRGLMLPDFVQPANLLRLRWR